MNDKILTLSVVGCLLIWAGIIGDLFNASNANSELQKHYEAAMKAGKELPQTSPLKQPQSDFKAVFVSNDQPIQKQPQRPAKQQAIENRLVFIKEDKSKK